MEYNDEMLNRISELISRLQRAPMSSYYGKPVHRVYVSVDRITVLEAEFNEWARGIDCETTEPEPAVDDSIDYETRSSIPFRVRRRNER